MSYEQPPSTLAAYGIGIIGIVGAIGLRYALTPWLGTTFPLATTFAAVSFVVWRAGAGPALLAGVGGWALSGFVFRGGINYFGGLTFNEIVGFITYLVAIVPIIVLGHAMRSAQRKLEARHEELSTTNLALENRIEAQSLLAAIVASSEDAIISKTLDGVITSWNSGAERLLGWKHDEAIGQAIHLIVPPELRDQERGLLEKLRSGQRVKQLETQRLKKNGERVDVAITISPVFDRHGNTIGASTTARDITARKIWEAQLVRSAEAQSLLVGIHDATRGLADPAIVMREIVTRVGLHFKVTRCAYGEVDGDETTLTISRGFTDGVPTVAGRYTLDAFGPLLAGELKTGRTAVINDVRTDPLTDNPSSQATYASMEIGSLVVVPLVRNGRLVAVLVMCDRAPRVWTEEEARLLEQVAERTLFAVESARAVAALRENRDVLALAMSGGRMGVWSRDLVTDSMWWSPELARILGLDGSPATRALAYSTFHPDDLPVVSKTIEEAIRTHHEFSIAFRFKHAATGEMRWMEANGKAVYAADGKPQMLFGLGIDITDRQRAVEALQEADRRKDEFLATLAHELRNPLAPISSGLYILRGAASETQASAALAIMDRQVGQMVRLVDDLLDVARITTGKVEIRRERIDLAVAIRDAIETTAPVLGDRPAFSVQGPAQPVFVDADRTRLAQVFGNLLNNSVKYSEAGQPITLTFGAEGQEAVVRVRDAGIGMAPDMLPRVFDMFRQGDRTGERARGGLGIGLSLVKRIVELHGGTVTAHSDGPGLGSEFVVRIPAAPAAHASVRIDVNGDDAASASPRRILVVDDNEDAAESLAALLAINGHETRLAHDGPEAVKTAADFNPDVVFLDIGMPTMDGHETAKLIRQQPWGKHMVLVALTGWGQSEDRRRSKDAGFNHHLVKPADPAVVQKLLASL